MDVIANTCYLFPGQFSDNLKKKSILVYDAGFMFRFESVTQMYFPGHYMTQIVVSTNCASTTELNLEITTQTNLPWMGSLYHIITIRATISRITPLYYTDLMVADQRHIMVQVKGENPLNTEQQTPGGASNSQEPRGNSLVSGENTNQNCSLGVRLEPKVDVPAMEPGASPDSGPCSTSKTNGTLVLTCPGLEETSTYFILMGPLSYSWSEASDLCADLDATLPSINTPESQDILFKLMLRTFPKIYFKGVHRMTQCRQFDPLCGFYIGLHKPRVSREVLIVHSYI